MKLPLDADDATILAAVRAWVTLLAEERYQDAYDALYHPVGDHWTPRLIETAIRTYGSIEPAATGTSYRVTPLETAIGELSPRHEVDRFDDMPGGVVGLVGMVWFDLPLNGRWSDLTATFYGERRDATLVVELNDIHVM